MRKTSALCVSGEFCTTVCFMSTKDNYGCALRSTDRLFLWKRWATITIRHSCIPKAHRQTHNTQTSRQTHTGICVCTHPPTHTPTHTHTHMEGSGMEWMETVVNTTDAYPPSSLYICIIQLFSVNNIHGMMEGHWERRGTGRRRRGSCSTAGYICSNCFVSINIRNTSINLSNKITKGMNEQRWNVAVKKLWPLKYW